MDDLNTVLGMISNGNINYASRLRGINDAYGVLDGMTGLSDEQRDGMKDILKQEKNNTIAGATLTGITGALSLASQFADSAQGADTSMYDSQLAGMRQNRGQNFYNNTALLNAYGKQSDGFETDVKDLNKTGFQSAMSIGSSALTGATTGAMFGPWGAAIGGAIGLIGGIGADQRARNINQLNVDRINHVQDYEKQMNSVALASGADQARQTQFGIQYGSRKSMGGFLKNYTGDSSKFIHHSHCKGGTLVRIKAK